MFDIYIKVLLTEGATAQSSVDFIASEMVVIFPPMSQLEKVAIQIVDDDVMEQTETFLVVLKPVRPGVLVARMRAEISIVDDDWPGV